MTAMVRSAYIDLLVDPRALSIKQQVKKLAVLVRVLLLLGSFIGASAYQYMGPAFALLWSALCKAAIFV